MFGVFLQSKFSEENEIIVCLQYSVHQTLATYILPSCARLYLPLLRAQEGRTCRWDPFKLFSGISNSILGISEWREQHRI